jgi:hypothetical protein
MTRPTPKALNALADYNTPPRFPVISNQSVLPGQTNTVNIRAIDPDIGIPTYAIVSAPEGSIIFQTGVYRWIVPTNQPPGDYTVTVSVLDDGTPPRGDLMTFTVTVRASSDPPVMPDTPGPLLHSVASINGQATFTINTLPGRTYRVLYKDDLGASAWTPLGADFVAANATASFTDHGPAPQRFYQVQEVN